MKNNSKTSFNGGVRKLEMREMVENNLRERQREDGLRRERD